MSGDLKKWDVVITAHGADKGWLSVWRVSEDGQQVPLRDLRVKRLGRGCRTNAGSRIYRGGRTIFLSIPQGHGWSEVSHVPRRCTKGTAPRLSSAPAITARDIVPKNVSMSMTVSGRRGGCGPKAKA